MPRVSILTPTYNHAPYIEVCISSVQQQTFVDWEMWVLDDGSTDGTDRIVQEKVAADPRIHYLRLEHRGAEFLKETYNEGLRRATGDYIAVLEGDDLWHQDKLQKQMAAIEEHPEVVCVWSRAEKLFGNGQSQPMLDKPLPTAQRSNVPRGSFSQVLLRENPVPALTILFSTKTLRRIGGFDSVEGLPLVDLPTLLRMSVEGEFVLVDESLGYWRQHASQVTKTKALHIIEGVYVFRKKFIHEHKGLLEGIDEEILLTNKRKSELGFYAAQCLGSAKKKDWKEAVQWSAEMSAYRSYFNWKHRALQVFIACIKVFVRSNETAA